jgi:hypothetical protein
VEGPAVFLRFHTRPEGLGLRLAGALRAQGAETFSSAALSRRTHEALALPALKRVMRVETLLRSAKALLPPA